MIDNEDHDALIREKVFLKLLRLNPKVQEGFILTDFPQNVKQAELLELFKGGMNAFVHMSLPDHVLLDIEQSKYVCKDSGKVYYKKVYRPEDGIYIESFYPEDGHCYDSGSTNIVESGDPIKFEQDLEEYKQAKDELLGFYDHYGLLVDFEPKKGYGDYHKLKKKIQYICKQ